MTGPAAPEGDATGVRLRRVARSATAGQGRGSPGQARNHRRRTDTMCARLGNRSLTPLPRLGRRFNGLKVWR